MKAYAFKKLPRTSKEYAIRMFNKYNNPKGLKDPIAELSKSYWQFNKDGSIFIQFPITIK